MAHATPHIAGLPRRFQAVRYLSRGERSEVIEAIDLDRGATAVAVKVLRATGPTADIARAMFRREVEALKGLEHEAVVRIIDRFEGDEGLLGIVLELVPEGVSLSKLFENVSIGRQAAPSVEWRLRMVGQLVDAVLAAHARDVIHRDIKPGNVLWNQQADTLALADFGIAAVLSMTARDPSAVTLRSFFSRPYAAPEQLLQRPPSFATDVYACGLLAAAIMALREPDADFEAAHLPTLLSSAKGDLQAAGIAERDVAELEELLGRCLRDAPSERPSLVEMRDIFVRVGRGLIPRESAYVVLTDAAKRKLSDVGHAAEASWRADLEAGLRIAHDRTDNHERIKLYGAKLFIVLRVPSDDGAGSPLLVIDAGENDGPIHEAHRRTAVDCTVQVRVGRGSGEALVEAARATSRRRGLEATHELVARARQIIALERERLPAFAIDATVLDGRPLGGTREERVGQASGYEGSVTKRVEVSAAFRIRVGAVVQTKPSLLKNCVKAHLEEAEVGDGGGTDQELDESDPPDWFSVFDDPGDVDLLDRDLHLIGKITRYDPDSRTLHVRTDKTRRLLVRGPMAVKDHQKERQLRQQELAIERLERGEAVRPDLKRLLADAAAHAMGEKPWVELVQKHLTPAARVRDIIDRILASQSIFCLQGPPGTGKTTVIAEVVAQWLQREPGARILICSQANDAVANAIERVLKLRDAVAGDWIVVRDVRAERAREEGEWSGYDAAFRHFVERVRVATRDLRADEGATEPADTSAATSVASAAAVDEWLGDVEHAARHVRRDYCGLVQVWGTTTARTERPLGELGDERHYDLVIVDEAAKATVGEVLVPIVNARRLLLVGDQRQLPPYLEDVTVEALSELGTTPEEAKYTLFEHLLALVPSDHRDMLNTQFRMHPTIGALVSELFYDGKLGNGPGTDKRPMPAGEFDRQHRVMWLDVVGADDKVGTSRANDQEVGVVVRTLAKLDVDVRRANAAAVLSVAVIAPYRAQVARLQREIERYKRRWSGLAVQVATIDSFQGREADVVLFSLVRTGSAERRFVADGRRFNVALSRARSLLVLIGDRSGSRATPTLQTLLDRIPAENQIASETLVPEAEWKEQMAAAARATPPRPPRR